MTFFFVLFSSKSEIPLYRCSKCTIITGVTAAEEEVDDAILSAYRLA